MTTSEQESKEIQSILWEEFLANHPPGGRWVPIENLAKAHIPAGPRHSLGVLLNIPDLKLFCGECKGVRIFGGEGTIIGGVLSSQRVYEEFLDYICKNCQKYLKKYAVLFSWSGEGLEGTCIKLGEYPPFGPRVPARVIRLIQDDKDVFLVGRRAENQGMGIGAFAYYRRVVENQKNRIIDEIIKVGKKLGAEDEIIKSLETAKKEIKFKEAVESIKGALPVQLLIDGHHNPLTLLHDALSKGLHAKTDGECLDTATAIRVVLTDLAERIDEALKEKAELGDAIKKLMGSGSKEKT